MKHNMEYDEDKPFTEQVTDAQWALYLNIDCAMCEGDMSLPSFEKLDDMAAACGCSDHELWEVLTYGWYPT